MKTSILILLIILNISLTSCDPERFCTEPKCSYSDVNLNITATLSGKLDSIINIGDTIWLQVKIPDSMQTNYGEIVFGYLWQNSFFGIISGGGDSLYGEGSGVYINRIEMNQQSFIPSNLNSGASRWDYPTRNFVCYFIPKYKGRYVIELINGRIEMTDKKDKDWLINPSFTFNQPFRINQYLSWMDESMRAEAAAKLKGTTDWYCFEVK